jgi:hypothetical protein
MSFTEAEKQQWHAARKSGLNPEDFHPDDLAVELASLEDFDEDENGITALSECSNCGHALAHSSTAEFPLCEPCGG